MLRPNKLKSRLILIVTLIFFFDLLITFTIIFFGGEGLHELEGRIVINGTLRLIITVSVFGFVAPTTIGWITKHISAKYNAKRLFIEFLSILLISIVLGLITYSIFPHRFNDDAGPSIYPVARGPILNFVFGSIIFAIYEAWINFAKSTDLEISVSRLEKEQLHLKLHALQQKIDPHFMFNSLNVLSELVHEDSDKADQFINQFSKVYRYVLELNKESLVNVGQELEFLKSYQYLLKIRLGTSLNIENHIDERHFEFLLPPLSLQLLMENAIKHNTASAISPLNITLESGDACIIMKNNKQLRNIDDNSNGMGLAKLKESYSLMGIKLPAILDLEEEFIVQLPIIKKE